MPSQWMPDVSLQNDAARLFANNNPEILIQHDW